MVITHERAIASRMPRRVEMLDGRIVADTSQPSAAPPSEKAPLTYDPPHLRPSSSKVQ